MGAGLVSEIGLQPGRYGLGVSTFSLYSTGRLQLLVALPPLKLEHVPMSSLWQLLRRLESAPSFQPLKKSACQP